MSVFKNRDLLTNIKECGSTLRAYTNGGHQDSSLQGDLPGFFCVWYNPSSMVNILAWCDVRRKFRITTDTDAEAAINVHISKNHTIKFKEVESGLYIYNMEDTTKDNNGPLGHSFLNLTLENMSNFTKSQIRQAERAKK